MIFLCKIICVYGVITTLVEGKDVGLQPLLVEIGPQSCLFSLVFEGKEACSNLMCVSHCQHPPSGSFSQALYVHRVIFMHEVLASFIKI